MRSLETQCIIEKLFTIKWWLLILVKSIRFVSDSWWGGIQSFKIDSQLLSNQSQYATQEYKREISYTKTQVLDYCSSVLILYMYNLIENSLKSFIISHYSSLLLFQTISVD